MAQKITRIRLVLELDDNENVAKIRRLVYRQEDGADPGVRTNDGGKGDLGPADSAPGESAGTVSWPSLSSAADPTQMVADIVAAAKADAGI